MRKAFIDINKDASLSYEYVVVGSGAGGALTAAYLSAKGKRILVIEEGPLGVLHGDEYAMTNAVPRLFREGGLIPIFSNTNFVFAEGRCLGGSTMVNAGLINHLAEETVTKWEKTYLIEHLAWDIVRRYQNEIAQALDAHVLSQPNNPADTLFKKGAAAIGLDGYDIPVAVTEKKGELKKNNMQRTFLKWAIENGVDILTNCKVLSIQPKHNDKKNPDKLLAAYKSTGGIQHEVTITFKKLFVCAGSIQTPLLLRRSGIKRNVGNSIRFHPMLRVVAEFDQPVNAYTSPMSSFQVRVAPSVTLGASIPAPPMIASILGPHQLGQSRIGKVIKNMALYYVALHTNSHGSVRHLLYSKQAYVVRYRLTPTDLKHLSTGFAQLCRVLFSAGASRLYPSIINMRPLESTMESDRYFNDLLHLRNLNLMSIHSFSSCPMGEDSKVCAVDSFGKLHDFDNIYIHDASILPSSPEVNPQGPLMSIVLRNLEHNFG
jgi:choline dehydrogenase-like flavoprotein